MRVVQNHTELKSLCEELEKQQFITVDTEFVREKTYYPKLCLIQVGWREDAAIIDPLAFDLNLKPFIAILTNENILKVFHSARQDIEVFYHLSGKIPHPLFDTQIAASVCGFGRAVSYEVLVQSITKVELDKSSRLTDWSLRPLDEKQLEYALRDVTFLIPCYDYLVQYLEEHNRLHWINDETNDLLEESHYKIDPEKAWQKIKHSVHSAHFLSALQGLAAWREKRAMKFDVPRRSIIKDEILVSIAASMPKTIDDMKQVRNIRPDTATGKLGEEILAVLNEIRHKPISQELKKIDRAKHVHIPCGAAALTEVLKLLLRIKCEQEGVIQSVVADEEDIRNLACGNDKDNPVLQGWRYELFGKEALAFRKGLADLSYDTIKKQIVVTVKQKKKKNKLQSECEEQEAE